MSSAKTTKTNEPKFNLRKETVKTLHVKTGIKTAGCETQGCIVSFFHPSGPHAKPNVGP